MWNPYDFTGKKVLIAGGTSGIGCATARMLSKQGADIILLGRNAQKLEDVRSSLSGNGHKSYIVDFSYLNNIKEIFDEIVADQRKIDGMVYCAGVVKLLPVNSLKRQVMNELMTVNLFSFIEMVSILSKRKYHNSASIVGISSIATVYPQKCQGAYAASKSAMNTFVNSLALELCEKDMRINTIMPGAVDTRMYQEFKKDKSEEIIQKMENRQVLGISDPNDIASIILYLLSDASKAITGRAIFADAGFINV